MTLLITSSREYLTKEGYVIVAPGLQKPNASQFFTMETVSIECIAEKKTPTPPEKQGAPRMDTDALTKRILLRRNETELRISRKEIGDSNSALISYTRNEKDHEDIFSIDGVVGVIAYEFATTQNEEHVGTIIPYLKARRITGKNEVNFLKPGVTANVLSAYGFLAMRTIFDGSGIFDERYDSQSYSFAVNLSPSFVIGSGKLGFVLFGGPLPPFGLLTLRPDLRLKFAGQYIDDQGTNPALKNKHSYTSYGAAISTDIFVDLPIFSGFKGSVAYMLFENTGNTPNVERFEAKLAYAFPGNDNVTLNFEFARGRDVDTLIFEDRWMVGVGVRY